MNFFLGLIGFIANLVTACGIWNIVFSGRNKRKKDENNIIMLMIDNFISANQRVRILDFGGLIYVSPKEFSKSFNKYVKSWEVALYSVSNKGLEDGLEEAKEAEELQKNDPELFKEPELTKEDLKEQKDFFESYQKQAINDAKKRYEIYISLSENKRKDFLLNLVNDGLSETLKYNFSIEGQDPEDTLKSLRKYIESVCSGLTKNGYTYNKYYDSALSKINVIYKKINSSLHDFSDYRDYLFNKIQESAKNDHMIYDCGYYENDLDFAVDFQGILDSLNQLNGFIKENTSKASIMLERE